MFWNRARFLRNLLRECDRKRLFLHDRTTTFNHLQRFEKSRLCLLANIKAQLF